MLLGSEQSVQPLSRLTERARWVTGLPSAAPAHAAHARRASPTMLASRPHGRPSHRAPGGAGPGSVLRRGAAAGHSNIEGVGRRVGLEAVCR